MKNFIWELITSKKYFLVRFFFISGIFFYLYSCNFKIEKLGLSFDWNILLSIVALFLIGAFSQIIIFYISDIFCENKTFEFLEKFNEENFNEGDLSKLINELYEKKEITKDLHLTICYFLEKEPYYDTLYVSQGENLPPYNALTEENKKKRTKFLEELKNFVEKLKNE